MLHSFMQVADTWCDLMLQCYHNFELIDKFCSYTTFSVLTFIFDTVMVNFLAFDLLFSQSATGNVIQHLERENPKCAETKLRYPVLKDSWLKTSGTRKSCCPQQVVFRKPADYSKVVVYKCKLAVYKCKMVVYSKAAVYKCKAVVYSKAAVYKCKAVVHTCKLVVYSCKVLNFRFTTVILITLLDTVEVTPFFQFFV